jgi:hypothetical protein
MVVQGAVSAQLGWNAGDTTTSTATCPGGPGTLLGCGYQIVGVISAFQETVPDVNPSPQGGANTARECLARLFRTASLTPAPNGVSIVAKAICRS